MLLVLLLVFALVGGAMLVGSRLIQPKPADLGIFQPVSGLIVYGNRAGMWGDNPDGRDVRLTTEGGTPLGWSRDGTQLLVGRQGLLVLHADGSETRLTDGPTDSTYFSVAAISPDGARVVFGGPGDASTLYSIDTRGGARQTLLVADGLEGATFSPDGSQIAFVRGSGDNSHRVSVMNADGTNVREIVANEVTLGPGHVHGIAWSPTGDRIALGLAGRFYTFAPDGSGFTVVNKLAGRREPFWSPFIVENRLPGTFEPFWSPDGSQLEVRGPWHPGERR